MYIQNFAASSLVHVGFLLVLKILSTSKKHQCRWTNHDELLLGVNVCLHGVLI